MLLFEQRRSIKAREHYKHLKLVHRYTHTLLFVSATSKFVYVKPIYATVTNVNLINTHTNHRGSIKKPAN